eukprot:2148001-Karenia_brevis.AAC.1
MRGTRRLMEKYLKELKMRIEKRGGNKDDVFKHTGTKGCPGCSAIRRKMALQPHSQECRRRFEEILREEAT